MPDKTVLSGEVIPSDDDRTFDKVQQQRVADELGAAMRRRLEELHLSAILARPVHIVRGVRSEDVERE